MSGEIGVVCGDNFSNGATVEFSVVLASHSSSKIKADGSV